MNESAIMEVFGGPADGVFFDFVAAYGKQPVVGDLVTHRRIRGRVSHLYRVDAKPDFGWKLVYLGPERVECQGK